MNLNKKICRKCKARWTKEDERLWNIKHVDCKGYLYRINKRTLVPLWCDFELEHIVISQISNKHSKV